MIIHGSLFLGDKVSGQVLPLDNKAPCILLDSVALHANNSEVTAAVLATVMEWHSAMRKFEAAGIIREGDPT